MSYPNSHTDILKEKQRLRQQVLKDLQSFPAHIKHAHNLKINQYLNTYWQALKAQFLPQAVLGFYPLSQEVDITPFLKLILKTSVPLYLPKVQDLHLEFYRIPNLTDLELGPLNTYEPPQNRETWWPSPTRTPTTLVLVPLLGFDASLNRLGRGKGFYDRFLSQGSFQTIGIAYGVQKQDNLPKERWDQQVDAIITENGLLKINSLKTLL